MHELYELKEMLMEELKQYSNQSELTSSTLEVIDKLSHAIKNICKIIEAYEEEEYSGRNSYEGGRFYSREGGNRGGGRRYSYEGNSYARGRGRNARRDSMGRYSREGGYSRDGGYSMNSEEMVENLRELMQDAPNEQTRQMMQSMIQQMEQM